MTSGAVAASQLLFCNSSVSHFVPALESVDFQRPPTFLLWFEIGSSPWIFFSGRRFCCIYWISSALSSLTRRSVHLSVWLTARGDRVSELFTARLFALPLRYMGDTRLWGKVNGELREPLSITNTCSKGTIIGACRLELSGACCECILFAALDNTAWSLVFWCQVHWPSEVWHCLVRRERWACQLFY